MVLINANSAGPPAATAASASPTLPDYSAATLLIAAWPTWVELPGSVKVAQDIAATSNPGNLHSPLRAVQVLGVWLGGSYKLSPHGGQLAVTHVLMALTVLAAALGALHLLRRRLFALGGWFVLMLLAWLLVSLSVSTWAAAKALMLTSPFCHASMAAR